MKIFAAHIGSDFDRFVYLFKYNVQKIKYSIFLHYTKFALFFGWDFFIFYYVFLYKIFKKSCELHNKVHRN
jgi:Ca2+/Na+ antiporter